MAVKSAVNATQVVITIDGRLDYSRTREFRAGYEAHSPSMSFVLDFSSTEYIDSSGLGMLLVLRDYAGGDKSSVTLRNCSTQVRQILEIAKFDDLFSIS